MARNYQSGFSFGSSHKSYDSSGGPGSGPGSISRSAGSSLFPASGSNIASLGGSSYTSTPGSSGYNSGFSASRYGPSSYSQSGYGSQSYSSGSYQSPGFNSASVDTGSSLSTGSYGDYRGTSGSGIGSTSRDVYSGNYGGKGPSSTQDLARAGLDSSYEESGQSGGSGLDKGYRGGTGASNIVKSTTDTLTLSDFIDDKRGDKSWDPVKRKYIQDRYEREEQESSWDPVKRKYIQDRYEREEQESSWDPVKRKYVQDRYEREEQESLKRQRFSRETSEGREADRSYSLGREADRSYSLGREADRSYSLGRESERRDERRRDEKVLMYLGNMPSNITKEKIETMFAYIPGIVSYSLQRHKYNMSNTCIFVEMTSREAGENLRKTFDWMEVNGRCIVCRFCREEEKEDFIPDLTIRSDNFEYDSRDSSQSKSKANIVNSVCVSNLPGDSTKDDLEGFVCDLSYRSMDFVKGDHMTGKTGYAYFKFDHNDDAEKMARELQGTYYLGNYISTKVEQGKPQEQEQDKDDYLPVPLEATEGYISGLRRATERAPAVPKIPKKQPSAHFEEYIKGQENTPLIGLEYITEYTTKKKNTPRYQCELCAATPQGCSVLDHIISAKHRLNYMEKKDPDRYQRITAMSQQKAFLTAEGLKFATEVEEHEGRQLIKMEQDPQHVAPRVGSSGMRQPSEVDHSSDLFSRLSAYKEKIKQIEDQQKEKHREMRTSEDDATDQRNEAKSVLKKQLAKTEEPVLGLEFLKAQPLNLLRPGGIPLNCTLCGSQLGHHSSALAHITGLGHRLEYFKRRHHDLYLFCSKITNRSSQRKLVEEHSLEIERQDGRGTLYIDGELIAGENKEKVSAPSVPSQPSAAAVDTKEVEMEISTEDEDFGSVKAFLFDLVKNMDNVPLVGLRYVTETQSYNSYDPPKYKCSLCDVNVSKTFIVTHLTGHQHRLEYIKKNYPELEKDADSDRETLNNYCRDIENDIGREPVNIVMMRPPKDLNSPVTYSRPIPVKAPSFKAEQKPIEPEPTAAAQAEPPTAAAQELSVPTPAPELPLKSVPNPVKPKILMSKMEKRAYALQDKIQNKDSLTPQQQIELERQLKNEGKKEDGSVVHFYDLIEDHENEALLGLGSCIEVWHPKDLEPPLFRCDICAYDTNFKQIVAHLIGKQHKLEYFKIMHPNVYEDLVRIRNPQLRDKALHQKVREFDSTHVRETIQYTVATDDSPWKNWKKSVNLMAYMRFDAKKRVKKLEKENLAAESVPTYTPDPPQHIEAIPDSTRNVEMDQKEQVPRASDGQEIISVADMIDQSVISDEKWEKLNMEIKKRISDGRIIIKKDRAKFLQTYTPFLTKFPIIGLEWLSEFQLGDENAEPWYLCRLCHSKITWSDVVDHLISIYHRMSFIQKEHPTLHELLKEEMWKPGGEREMKEKIEEFARGVAKPPSEQTLEVLMERVKKPEDVSPMKDFTHMAQKQGVMEQGRQLDGSKDVQQNMSHVAPIAVQQQPPGQQVGAFQRQQPQGQVGAFQRQEPQGQVGAFQRQGPQGQVGAFQRQEPPGVMGYNVQKEPQFQQPGQFTKEEPDVVIIGSESPQKPMITATQAARNARRASLVKVPGATPRFPMLFGSKVFQALVGLEYLVEIQIKGEQHKPPEYVCELCDCECGPTNVIQHLCGNKHRTNFFTAKFPERNGQVTEQMAGDYEKKYGRGIVQVVIEDKGMKKQRQLDSKNARKEVRIAKTAWREHNLQKHQELEKQGVGEEQSQEKVAHSPAQANPEVETPAAKRGLKITPGAIPKFPVMFGSKATRALVGLDHLIEIQMVGAHKERRPEFLCELCDCDVGPGSILAHLYGHKHRQKFFASLGKPAGQVTEEIAINHEKTYGRARVRVVIEDYQTRKIREKQKFDKTQERKEQVAKGSSETSIKSLATPALQSVAPTMPTVAKVPAIDSTSQPGNSFSGQQIPLVHQERISPFAPQNLPQAQGPQAMMQMQSQPQFQQPRPLMQQQPAMIQQPMLQQQGPLMMQQQLPVQQSMPMPLMQQPVQQPTHIMTQPQVLQPPAFNNPVQRQPQLQPSPMVLQHPQMMPQMQPNIGPGSQQQNVPAGMQNMRPQQNSQMRMAGTSQPVSSQQYIGPRGQPPHGIPVSKNVSAGAYVPNPQGFNRLNRNQQGPTQSLNVHSFPNSHSRQLTYVNIQKATTNQSTDEKPLNKDQSQKVSRSDSADKKEFELSGYKIPRKDLPMKDVKVSDLDKNQKERTDSRKLADNTRRDSTGSQLKTSGQGKDDQNSRKALDSRSGGRHQESRNARSKSRESRGSSSRREPERSPDNRSRQPEKEKSSDYKYTDHRSSEKSSSFKFTDHRNQSGKRSDSTITDKQYDNKKSASSSKEKKKVNESKDKSNDNIVVIDQDKSESSKTKSSEAKKADESKSEVLDDKKNERSSKAVEKRSNSSGSKSGSFIEIDDRDANKKSAEKQKPLGGSCVINVDVRPKRKDERTELQEEKAKQSKIAATVKAPATPASKSIDINSRKGPASEATTGNGKQDKTVLVKEETNITPFKSPLKTSKGKLACAVTVDLIDISTLSPGKLRELKQNSTPIKTPQAAVLEVSSDLKSKVKQEITSPQIKIKEELMSPQSKTKDVQKEFKQPTTFASKIKKEVASPISKQSIKTEPVTPETVKRKSVGTERSSWSVKDEWAENEDMDLDSDAQRNGGKRSSRPADKVNVVVEVGDQKKQTEPEVPYKEENMPAGCSVTIEVRPEPKAMEVELSNKDDQISDDNFGEDKFEGSDEEFDFSEFVTLDEEGEVDDIDIASIPVMQSSLSEKNKKDSKRSRSRSRDRSHTSGRSEHSRRSRSKDRYRSRSSRSRSKDRGATRSGKSSGDSQIASSSLRQEASKVKDTDSRSQKKDTPSSSSKSSRTDEGSSGSSSRTTKPHTRMTVEVEMSDKPTKPSDKPDRWTDGEEGFVASSRALLKERDKSRGAKSKCSVEIGMVEKREERKMKDSEKKEETDRQETRSNKQTRSQKPKCEVSVSIN